ncbi:TolB domain-containing protein [Paenibacillus sp. FSL R7-277]|uniref:DUF3889 domain-containing protein n=1 Tax=unclassified Paenibacillus TaxID=185978 RepID=UPI0003E22C88|nr:DUF3889 domain-containing protein [Paenibacillus sp. FSL R7-277]ETT62791.1 TolB domain-containing protein [Paenibacillus sp. FSL R7-277]
MKKIWTVALLTLALVLSSPLSRSSAAPDYARWGTIAVKETQQKYNAEIIDYKHIGRTQIKPKLAEEKFKLVVRSKAGREFGVVVMVRFNPSTNKLQTIQFLETKA